ncbi:hypothetical protein ACIQAL_09295 [Pseudomonas sp. NPDC088368]|uniref:hypothetical protein n=1 Tax=Pseudomonas sp. NPDC088368 TaxID=3364453 RepID=UPI00382C4125
MALVLDEAEKQILGALLVDFGEQRREANDLRSAYEGPRVSQLAAAICAGDITQVDFDLAFRDLEKKKLIRSGPFALYDNAPNSGITIIGGYSRREYASLTESGYKSAKQTSNRPSKPQRSVTHNVHISGGSFSNFQLSTGDNVKQNMSIDSATSNETLAKIIEILESKGDKVSVDDRAELVSAIDEANDGNGGGAKRLLEKVCGPAWTALQPVIWPFFGQILKKSLDLGD